MTDELPKEIPGWAIPIFVRLVRLETKMNIVGFVAGASLTAMLGLLVVLLTGIKLA